MFSEAAEVRNVGSDRKQLRARAKLNLQMAMIGI